MRVEVEGGVGGGSLAVCEELVSHSWGRRSVEPTRGQACGKAQGGGAGVLVAYVALAGMLDLLYLRVATHIHNMSSAECVRSLMRDSSPSMYEKYIYFFQLCCQVCKAFS